MRDPLVMIPGLMCDARLFGPQILTLSKDRVVTIALPTCGERVEEIASNMLDVLPARFALAGHGLGGNVAMELFRRAPDRITRLALMSASSLAETPQTAADLEPSIIKLRSGRLENAIAGLVPTESLAPGNGRPGIQEDLRAMASHLSAPVIIAQIRALQRRVDYQTILRKSSVPVRLICGQCDTLVPVKRHELMAGLIPGAILDIIPDAGHLLPLEAPLAVTDTLSEWLEQC